MKKFAKVIAVVMVVMLAMAVLVSCGPNADPQKARAALEEKKYVVTLTPGSSIGNYEYRLAATNLEESITITWYKSSDDAKSAVESAKENLKEGWKAGRVGKMVWIGTEQAIKDAR